MADPKPLPILAMERVLKSLARRIREGKHTADDLAAVQSTATWLLDKQEHPNRCKEDIAALWKNIQDLKNQMQMGKVLSPSSTPARR
jgi:orotate phosphoribosyltransferase-like protein